MLVLEQTTAAVQQDKLGIVVWIHSTQCTAVTLAYCSHTVTQMGSFGGGGILQSLSHFVSTLEFKSTTSNSFCCVLYDCAAVLCSTCQADISSQLYNT